MTLLLTLALSLLPRASVTAYTAADDCPGRFCDGVNAMMQTPVEGRSLACPPHIPLGATVWIETVGIRTCDDRGGKVKGRTFDLYMDDRSDALAWGRRTLRYVVIE